MDTPPQARELPASVDATQAALAAHDYLADRALATALYLSLRLARPLFLEGEPGTGKTELAKTVAALLERPLIRLQCYEGLDIAAAAYEWNYARQMIEIRLADQRGAALPSSLADELFGERFLIPRALYRAIDPANPVAPVLLIDELDRADEPFEAYLLEVLAEFQLTIPELGTVRAKHAPLVFVTSNRTREIHDAIKRRCLYHWVEFPDAARELQIVRRRIPGIDLRLSQQVVAFVQRLRELELYKQPGITESIEWARALRELDSAQLDAQTVNDTLGVLLKYQDDIARIEGSEAARLVDEIRSITG
jgi:MoxR-like ATPase